MRQLELPESGRVIAAKSFSSGSSLCSKSRRQKMSSRKSIPADIPQQSDKEGITFPQRQQLGQLAVLGAPVSPTQHALLPGASALPCTSENGHHVCSSADRMVLKRLSGMLWGAPSQHPPFCQGHPLVSRTVPSAQQVLQQQLLSVYTYLCTTVYTCNNCLVKPQEDTFVYSHPVTRMLTMLAALMATQEEQSPGSKSRQCCAVSSLQKDHTTAQALTQQAGTAGARLCARRQNHRHC